MPRAKIYYTVVVLENRANIEFFGNDFVKLLFFALVFFHDFSCKTEFSVTSRYVLNVVFCKLRKVVLRGASAHKNLCVGIDFEDSRHRLTRFLLRFGGDGARIYHVNVCKFKPFGNRESRMLENCEHCVGIVLIDLATKRKY